MDRKIAAFVLLALLALPRPALAQAPIDPEPPAPIVTPVYWDDIPDILSYVEFGMPQCAGPNAIGLQRREPPAGGTWWDMGRHIGWLAWQIENTIVGFSCWLLGVNQHLFNALAILTNALISGLNFLWRLFIFCWLWLRNAFVGWWVFSMELLRSLWFSLLDFFQWIWEMAIVLWEGFLAIIALLWQFVLLIVDLGRAALGLLAWIGAIVITTIRDIWAALFWEPGGQGNYSGTMSPGRLTTTEQFYCMARGAIDAVHQHSHVGWIFYAMYGMAYVWFVYWFVRFISRSSGAKEEA